MLKMTDIGLFCEPGNFYIDPLNPCDTAVITHAHADHARAGMNNYICTPETASIMRSRIDQNLSIRETKYNQSLRLGKTTVRPEITVFMVPYFTAIVPEAEVEAIPPIAAFAPGSIGKKTPSSLKYSFNCSFVTQA